MVRKIIVGAVALLGIGALSLFLLMPKGPDLKAVEFLKEPRITKLPDRKMLVVTAPGDPNTVGSKAFGLLFKTYFKIPGVSKSVMPAPRARWAGDMKVKSSWTGYYALPLPEETGSLPSVDVDPGYKIELAAWEYGDVAEILHIGPYAEETPTIERIHQFISRQGYTIAGLHEEEYVKGPGMFFKGDPKHYYTIIRYRITKH